MEKFGVIKNKMLTKLTESYTSENKKEIKKLLGSVKTNKEFVETYLFYEMVESKCFDSKETATLFLEEAEGLLAEKRTSLKPICESLSETLKDVDYQKNEIYECLDILAEKKTLNNVEAKVSAKQKLIKHLITKKGSVNESVEVKIDNQGLLNAVLVNNFNTKFAETLNEEQKETFNKIVSMSQEEVNTEVSTIKESLTQKLDALIAESTDDELIDKLGRVKQDVESSSPTKLNYYRLTELKNNL